MTEDDLMRRAQEIQKGDVIKPNKDYKVSDFTDKSLDELRENQKKLANRRKGKNTETKHIPYEKKVIDLIPVDKFKRLMYEYWKDAINGQPIIYEKGAYSTKDTLHQLTLYFLRDKECELDINKGLYITGAYGTGKTKMMNAWYRAMSYANMMRKGKFYTWLKKEYGDLKRRRPVKT